MRMSGLTHSVRTYDLSLNAGYAAATVVVLAALGAGVFLPIHRETTRLAAEANTYRDLIQTTSQITVERQRLETQLAAKEAAVAELLQRIPSAPQEAEFLAQMCELARRTGLEVTDYHPGAIEQRENYQELEVKFRGRGEYAAICRFLHQSDEIPRLRRLTHIEITAGEAEQPLACEFTYRIFFAPPAAAERPKQETAT